MQVKNFFITPFSPFPYYFLSFSHTVFQSTNFKVLYGTSATKVDGNVVYILVHVSLPETGADSTVIHISGTSTEHYTESV
jgi:hypothetical protein